MGSRTTRVHLTEYKRQAIHASHEQTPTLDHDHQLDINCVRLRRSCYWLAAKCKYNGCAAHCRTQDSLVRARLPDSPGGCRRVYALRLQLGTLASGSLDSGPHNYQRPTLALTATLSLFGLRRDSLFSFSPAGVGIFSRHESRAATQSELSVNRS